MRDRFQFERPRQSIVAFTDHRACQSLAFGQLSIWHEWPALLAVISFAKLYQFPPVSQEKLGCITQSISSNFTLFTGTPHPESNWQESFHSRHTKNTTDVPELDEAHAVNACNGDTGTPVETSTPRRCETSSDFLCDKEPFSGDSTTGQIYEDSSTVPDSDQENCAVTEENENVRGSSKFSISPNRINTMKRVEGGRVQKLRVRSLPIDAQYLKTAQEILTFFWLTASPQEKDDVFESLAGLCTAKEPRTGLSILRC